MNPSPARFAGRLQDLPRVARYLPLAVSILAVIMVYVWFVSVGYWTIWPKTTYVYDLLADAFRHGHVVLEDKPSPELLSLSDPYDPGARAGIPAFWDASLYRGQYTFYFGPAPALLLAAGKIVIQRQVADQYLAFAFVTGVFAVISLFLITLWQRHFPDLPIWTLALNLLAAGLLCPSIWLLSRPSVYEVALASGQLFFLGGVFLSYLALRDKHRSTWLMLLAGLSWSFALASRTTVLAAIALVILTLAWWMQKAAAPDRMKRFFLVLAFAGLPLLLTALGLAAYNYARFGSPLEFGFRYQLTWVNLHKYFDAVYSPAYILPNLREYLFMPYQRIGRFPFLEARSVDNPVFQSHIAPDVFMQEPLTGLLVSSPYLLFSLVPPALLAFGWRREAKPEQMTSEDRDPGSLTWLILALSGAAVISAVLLGAFFYATMRYLEDFTPSLTLLASIGLWQGYRFVQPRLRLRIPYSLLAWCLVGCSSLVSVLLAITGYEQRFRHLNRALLQQMIRFFAR